MPALNRLALFHTNAFTTIADATRFWRFLRVFNAAFNVQLAIARANLSGVCGLNGQGTLMF